MEVKDLELKEFIKEFDEELKNIREELGLRNKESMIEGLTRTTFEYYNKANSPLKKKIIEELSTSLANIAIWGDEEEVWK